MSPKGKRSQRRQTPRPRPTSSEATAQVAPASPVKSASGLSGRRTYERQFNPDYTYVIKDLKRIGTLAGSFFLLLIVLSFFLK